ncbi:MAG: amidohydrolase family protein [Myxococcales bacterium]|nr:amidohydrolase family protein [Myxococcales bacterium]
MQKEWNPSGLDRICNVTLVDPESGSSEWGVDIDIDGHRIGELASSRKPRARPFDGEGLYAIPGLIDAHLHALGPLYGDLPTPTDLLWVFRQQKRNLRALLRSGITTIRDMAAPLKLVRSLSRRAARFEIESPRILYAGPMLTTPGGYPHYLGKLPLPLRLYTGAIREEIRNQDDVRRVVEELHASGAQCVKVAYQRTAYDDARSPLPTLSPSLIAALVREADRYGLSVALHNVYLDDLRTLRGVPFDSLEHLPIDAPMEEDDVAELVARQIPLTSTLAAYGLIDHIDELIAIVEREPERFEAKPRQFLRATYAALKRGVIPNQFFGESLITTGSRYMRENLKRCVDAGAPLLFGTDTGSGVGLPGCPWFELEQLERAGFTRQQALVSATCGAADILGQPDLGRIRPGARADITLLAANPLDDLQATREVVAVVRDGRLVWHDAARRRQVEGRPTAKAVGL